MSVESDNALRPAAAIILAAGKSTRMRSSLPKPLHPVCGIPMTEHVIRACKSAGIHRIVVVIGHEAELVREGLGDSVEYVVQHEQKGTAHAVQCAQSLLSHWDGPIITLAGDTPLLQSSTIAQLLQLRAKSNSPLAMLTVSLPDPAGYGRIIRDSEGQVCAIIEEKDASASQREISECNPSLYAFNGPSLWKSLKEIKSDNVQGEFYLTDVISILRKSSQRIESLQVQDHRDVLGVNNRVDLSVVQAVMKQRLMEQHMLNGVTVTDPSSTYIEMDVEIGQDTLLEPNTILLRGTRIGQRCHIGAFSRLERAVLEDEVKVLGAWITDSTLHNTSRVGPFSQLRPGSTLNVGARVGNFVELKNTTLGVGAQALHLSYLGDTEVGDSTNIGAGVITCNYDGFLKHRTVIGERCFIGSHVTLIAPIVVGNGAFLAAGSPISENVPSDAFAIARERAVVKPDWAAKYRARKLAEVQQKKSQAVVHELESSSTHPATR